MEPLSSDMKFLITTSMQPVPRRNTNTDKNSMRGRKSPMPQRPWGQHLLSTSPRWIKHLPVLSHSIFLMLHFVMLLHASLTYWLKVHWRTLTEWMRDIYNSSKWDMFAAWILLILGLLLLMETQNPTPPPLPHPSPLKTREAIVAMSLFANLSVCLLQLT